MTNLYETKFEIWTDFERVGQLKILYIRRGKSDVVNIQFVT